MAKEADRKSARPAFGKMPPGAIMVALWFIGMMLFLCLVMTLHVVASVLTEVFAGS